MTDFVLGTKCRNWVRGMYAKIKLRLDWQRVCLIKMKGERCKERWI